MYRILLIGFWLAFLIPSSQAQQIQRSDRPEWAVQANISMQANRGALPGEGFRYLLFDNQLNLLTQETYKRISVQVLSADGIQANSDLEIEYDPSFQSLKIHEVKVYRAGENVYELDLADFKLIQKETGADRHIYDGAVTALLHLSGIQKNDIIDCSYTVQGFNPVYGEDYFGFLVHQLNQKVEKFHYRLLVPMGQEMQILEKGHSFLPKKTSSGATTIYTWDHEAMEALSFDANVPYWSALYPMTSFSTFPDWKSVVNWSLPLYSYSKDEVASIKKALPASRENISRITSLIRYVQDEIRYLGLEAGMSAYKPNSPGKVFKQKFGDCKDKSLLLVSLLQSEGLEAYPVLVNTTWKDNVAAFTANANAFDHCIVTYRWEGKDYYVDPTISDQGGNLTKIYFPDYRTGLVLKPGNAELTTLPQAEKAAQVVDEIFYIDDLEGNARLQIRTEYRGWKADEIRSSFENSTVEEISKTYLNFYSGLYPSIEEASPIEFLDADRNSSNVVTTLESYVISDFWQQGEEGLYAEVYPLELNSRINFPQSAARSMDYYVGELEKFSVTTRLYMPEPWLVSAYEKKIDGGAFIYENKIFSENNLVEIYHSFDLLKSSIPGSEVPELLQKKELVSNELTFFLTYNPGAGTGVSLPMLLVSVLLVGLFIYFGIKIYRGYNPEAEGPKTENGIGGWLILPAISLVIFPFTAIYNLVEGTYFTEGLWANAVHLGLGMQLFLGASALFLICMFCYSILVMLFFFKRRTGAPTLYITLIVVNFCFLLLENYLVDQVFPELGMEFSIRDVGRSFLGLIVWVPYFLKSERVKETFTEQYLEKKGHDSPRAWTEPRGEGSLG
ncbi:DUF3857 domain-containing protein [Algoriphagus namhaensis]